MNNGKPSSSAAGHAGPKVIFDRPPSFPERLAGRRPDKLSLKAEQPTSPLAQAEDPRRPVGICLSGGGVRSASFCLGALQAFQRAGWLAGERAADYLAAVSGGSYIAGAFTLASRGARDDRASAGREELSPVHDGFALGSAEESYLRRHLLFLREAPGGLGGAVVRVLLGMILNLSYVGLALLLVGLPLGWVYGRVFERLRNGRCDVRSTCPVDLDVRWALVAAVGLALVALAFGLWAVSWRWAQENRRRFVYSLAMGTFGLAALTFLVGVAFPKILELVRDVGDSVRNSVPGGTTQTVSATRAADEAAGRLVTVTGTGLAGVIATLLLSLRQYTTVEELRRTATGVSKRVRPTLIRLRLFLLNLAAAVLGPLLVLAGFVTVLNWGSADTPLAPHGPVGEQLFAWGGAAVLSALMFWRGDLVSWSLHPIYKRRLARAFALQRFYSKDGTVGAEEIPYDKLPPLSDQPDGVPKLLVCAAANVSDYGKTPAGANVTSFVFSADEVGSELTGFWSTRELENLLNRKGRNDLTLMTAVAITGAAISPSMGKMTRRPLRFLLAMANIRLGVWLPNPLWREWFLDPGRLRAASGSRGVFARPQYFLRELLGRNHLFAKFLYISDGGHYENLGLVELLRRGCQDIWCIDASGDPADTFSNLGQAIALARAEHLVEDIDIKPFEMAPDRGSHDDQREPPTVKKTHVSGTIRYPGGKEARLVYIKAGVPADAPSDVRAFQQRTPTFPCDPTANQLYTAERFEAYRALGDFATTRALEEEEARLSTTADGQQTVRADVAGARTVR